MVKSKLKLFIYAISFNQVYKIKPNTYINIHIQAKCKCIKKPCIKLEYITGNNPLLQLSNYNHQVDYFVATVPAGYFCVERIHQTLTWTTGFLMCTEILMHAIAHKKFTDKIKRVCSDS